MKKNIGKRILSLALALVMVAGWMPRMATEAHAAEPITLSDDTFTTSPGEGFAFRAFFYCNECKKEVYIDSNIENHKFEIISFTYKIANGTAQWNLTANYQGCRGSGTGTNTYSCSYNCTENLYKFLMHSYGWNQSTKKYHGSIDVYLTREKTTHQGDATCKTAANCTLCGTSYTNANNHEKPNEFTYSVNTSDSTKHDKEYACCGAVSETATHSDFTYSLNGNMFTKTCGICGHAATATLTADDAVYTGTPITAASITYSDGWQGEEKQPAEIADTEYINNTNAGTATVTTTVEGKELTTTFEITAKKLTSDMVMLSPTNSNYTGSVIAEPAVTVQDGTAMKESDYTVTWPNDADWTNAGTITVTVKGQNNYEGTVTKNFVIGKGTPTAELFQFELPPNAIYDGATAYSANVTSNASGLGAFTVKYNGSADAPRNAGTYKVTVDVATGDNYNAASDIELGSFTVAQADGSASVSADDVEYGDAVTPVPVSSTNGIDNVTYQYKVKDADDSTYTNEVPTLPGDYTVKATFPATTNYKMAEATADFTVSKRPITVTANDASKTYGGTDPELEWTVTSGTVLASDPLSVNISRVAGENAGDYTITVGQDEGANPNYDITFVNGTLTIHKASLTVIVKNQEIVYGDEIGEIIAGFDGFIDTTHYTTQLDFSNEVRTSTYKQYDDVGTYPITVSGITSNNYEITYVPGTLTVNPKPITVTIADKTSVYGEAVAELTAATDGIVNNDTNVYSLATTATSTANAGTYPITGTAVDSNYTITFVDGTYTITKAVAAAEAPAAKELTYDGTEQTLIDPGATNDGDLVYALEEEGEYTAELPKAKTAGTYLVWYKVIGDGNHFDSEPASVAVEIAKAEPGIGAVTADAVSDTQATSAIVLSREYTDIEGELTVDAEQTLAWGENTIAYTFTPTDGTNYKVVKGEVNVTALDTVDPVGTVKISTNSWAEFLNNITFGLFFKETQTVSVTASDSFSGIDKIEYIESKTPMDLAAVQAATQWQEMKDGSVSVTLEDAKQFVYYIRITDKAGNAIYLSTDGAEYDTTAPVIAGVDNGVTYYTTQKITVTDKNMDTITVNGETASDSITLEGNKEATYTIVATDKAGNSTTVTVTMKPIKELAKATENLGNDNVTSADAPALEELVAKLDELIADPDTSDDGERETLEQHKVIAEALLKTIEDVAKATDTENTAKVEDVTADNVTPEDKSNLEDAKADLEDALENNGGNYTEEEKQVIQDEIQRIEDAIVALENVEDVTDSITQLPETVEPDDEETAKKILDAKEAYDELTDHEKSLVDETTKKKLDDLVAALTAYDIIKGDGGKWTKGGSTGLTFTANGSFSKFVGIEVDGKEVDEKYYDAKAGSTIITLKQSYLKRLSTGEHTITVLYTDGETSGTFKILAASSTPATGDNSNIMLYSSMFTVSLAGLVVLLLAAKKRKHETA